MIFFLLIATISLILGGADNALAWGPGVHLALGNHVLAGGAQILPAVADLIARHPNMFLYGCLSADIFIGKGSSFTPTHSHNWAVGTRLLRSVRDDNLKSYAYGYLTHLAADTVAHNYYVPNAMGLAGNGSKLMHTYVEMQADRRVAWSRKQTRHMFKWRGASRAADTSLLETMDRRRTPFNIKKQLFRGSLFLLQQKKFQDSLGLVERNLTNADREDDLDRMLTLSLRAVIDFLSRPESSPVLHLDPIGSTNLTRVKHLHRSKRLQRRHREGKTIFPPDPRLNRLATAGEPFPLSLRRESVMQEAASF
ncbi:MAG TPA: zinc dependent phospholipase C family protein [Desulfomicrobiaceae bacterium]|nr:zinc dependent phospholipase C family protein [Desulfomicrobiaceae bacterium]